MRVVGMDDSRTQTGLQEVFKSVFPIDDFAGRGRLEFVHYELEEPKSAILDVIANIIIVPRPPKCLELNPQDNVWHFMHDNSLSKRVFASSNAIVYLMRCLKQTRRSARTIMSLGVRDWASLYKGQLEQRAIAQVTVSALHGMTPGIHDCEATH